AAARVPATSRPRMGDAPGGGGYLPARCRTSGRLTPAASTRISTSPGPGTGAGKYPPPPGASPILGLEVAGTIAAAAPGSRWREADRVCALVPGGGYAEYCLAPGVQCLPVPRGLSMQEAA